jgi:hypothetical protein
VDKEKGKEKGKSRKNTLKSNQPYTTGHIFFHMIQTPP